MLVLAGSLDMSICQQDDENKHAALGEHAKIAHS